MPISSLPSFAHALGASVDLAGVVSVLGDYVAELDRGAAVALFRFDVRRDLLCDRLASSSPGSPRHAMEIAFDHLAEPVREAVRRGGALVDVGDRTGEYALLLGFTPPAEGAALGLYGLRVDGDLGAVLVLLEPRKFFGARTSDRLSPALPLLDLAVSRLAERDAREEAVRTLEDVTRRVHAEYGARLAALEGEVRATREPAAPTGLPPGGRVLALEGAAVRAAEEVRQAAVRAEQAERRARLASGQAEQAATELQRRQAALQRRTHTVALMDRLLTFDAAGHSDRAFVDELLSAVGESFQAQRCSLLLRGPTEGQLYLAGGVGLAPHVRLGMRLRVGDGVAGRVAATREPLMVQDVQGAMRHPMLRDRDFGTGSFISFPLLMDGTVLGVMNLANRSPHDGYAEDDIERVRLVALAISVIVARRDLPRRMLAVIAAEAGR